MQEQETHPEEAWEAAVVKFCHAAKLTGIQVEVILYAIVEGMTPQQIKLKLKAHFRRVAEVQAVLQPGLKALAGQPGFWEAAAAFRRHLVFCVRDRRVYDERPPEVRGVAPDPSSGRLHGGVEITADDFRLRQSELWGARLWVNERRPVLVRR